MEYAKQSSKSLREKIDVVAHFHAYKIRPERIAYRTGIEIELVTQLINGEDHQQLFKRLLATHRKNRRDQRLKQSLRTRGIAQAEMQDNIEKEYVASLIEEVNKPG